MKRSEAFSIIDKAYAQFIEDWLKIDLSDDEMINNFRRLEDRIIDALIDKGLSIEED
jgi:hypothetical protein